MPSDVVLMIAGQSNATQMCREPVAGCVPMTGTYVWSGTAWRAMTLSDGAGMIALATDLRNAGYDNVYVYNCGYGGSAIIPAAAVPTDNCWSAQNPPIADCEAQVAQGKKKPQVVIWMQGEQEALYSKLNPTYDMVTNYQAFLGPMRLALHASWGATPRWIITPVGYVSYGEPNTVYVRLSQQACATTTPNVAYGPIREDLPLLAEGGVRVHLTGPACQTFGHRLAPIVLSFLEPPIMTDPQDKAAIVALQAAVAQIDVSLRAVKTQLASLQRTDTNLRTSVSALEVITRDGPIGDYGHGAYS